MAARRCRPMLGTLVEVRVGAAGASTALADTVRSPRPAPTDAHGGAVARAIEAAFAAVAEVERLMSFHDARSELSRLNAAGEGEVLTLHAWTVEVLALAQVLHVATGGRFDAAVAPVLVGWGLLPWHDPAAPAPTPAHAVAGFDVAGDAPAGAPRSSMRDIEISDAHHVRVLRPVCIDLGGIAKGFAVDKAVEALVANGVRRGVVNAGGDLRVLGEAPEPIHVRSPADPTRLLHLGDLADGAVATSASYFTGRERDGQWRGALIDPRSREAVPPGRSFSVIAPSCAVADGLTKALAVEGQLDDACLERFGASAVVL